MILDVATCRETVSILHALVFGAEGACVDIGLASLLGGVAVFVGAVVVLRFVGARIVRRVLGQRQKVEVAPEETPGLTRMPYESPIRSTGAWGRQAR